MSLGKRICVPLVPLVPMHALRSRAFQRTVVSCEQAGEKEKRAREGEREDGQWSPMTSECFLFYSSSFSLPFFSSPREKVCLVTSSGCGHFSSSLAEAINVNGRKQFIYHMHWPVHNCAKWVSVHFTFTFRLVVFSSFFLSGHSFSHSHDHFTTHRESFFFTLLTDAKCKWRDFSTIDEQNKTKAQRNNFKSFAALSSRVKLSYRRRNYVKSAFFLDVSVFFSLSCRVLWKLHPLLEETIVSRWNVCTHE